MVRREIPDFLSPDRQGAPAAKTMPVAAANISNDFL